MIVYMAGSESVVPGYRTDYGINNFLISFASIIRKHGLHKWAKWAGFKVGEKSKTKKLFLDSGAFSIFNGQGDPQLINLYTFIDFVEQYGKMFDVIAAFDVIRNPEQTMANYKDMLRANLDVIPTYHYPEPIEWLHKYCSMTDYVAIGGVAHLMMANRDLGFRFLQKIVETKPKDVKYHLFGVASNAVLKQYGPWIESVDTTKWLVTGRYNAILTRKGKSLVSNRDYDTRIFRADQDQIMRTTMYNIRRLQELESDVNEITVQTNVSRNKNSSSKSNNKK